MEWSGLLHQRQLGNCVGHVLARWQFYDKRPSRSPGPGSIGMRQFHWSLEPICVASSGSQMVPLGSLWNQNHLPRPCLQHLLGPRVEHLGRGFVPRSSCPGATDGSIPEQGGWAVEREGEEQAGVGGRDPPPKQKPPVEWLLTMEVFPSPPGGRKAEGQVSGACFLPLPARGTPGELG